MGFFNACWDLLLHLPFFAPRGGGFERDRSQLPISSGPSGGVVIHPENASPGFTCSYPSMEGWESCNSPDDRSCWLKDGRASQPYFSQYDIHTDYETVWPQGVTREVSVENQSPGARGTRPLSLHLWQPVHIERRSIYREENAPDLFKHIHPHEYFNSPCDQG
ncbi:hypothetical protein B0J12DRAFT_387613 [Macrophomina phaseolina]|uniref:Uncharacterized protein n=1 Tax=Macrophomina phaseolina TaxID=35725 RepID=A0ABQ8FTA1_9PEZI|nr:hypothetical protein B0J12DRAFT_387613 [Macrophomina phaseolina]